MYELLNQNPGGTIFVRFIGWWCSLFGISDPTTMRIVLGIVVAAILIGLVRGIWVFAWTMIGISLPR